MFSLQQNWRPRGGTSSAWKWGLGGVEVPKHCVHMYVSKCKTDKIKKKKNMKVVFLAWDIEMSRACLEGQG
jgi:hypothetical protein